MLDVTTDMRIEAAVLAAESKQLRVEGKRQLRRARHLRDTQASAAKTGLAYLKYNGLYQQRMEARAEARLLHLSRMMLKGKDYLTVEQTTHHRVNADDLAEYVWAWEPGITSEYVAEWLGQNDA